MVDHVPHVGGAGAGASARKLSKVYTQSEAIRSADAVSLSPEVLRLKGIEGIRLDKVMEIRRAIADGSYLTPAKLDQALDKAIDDAFKPAQKG